MKYLVGLFLVLLLGCASTNDNGGSAHITVTQRTQQNDISDHPIITDKVWDIELNQPENPEKTGTITLSTDKDGQPVIAMNTGSSFNTTHTKATTALLNPVIWVGTGLVVIGAVAFILSRNLITAGVFALTGLGLIAGSFLLAQYSFQILIGGIILAIVAAVYLLYRYKVSHQAAIDNTKLINVIKEDLPDEKYNEVFYGKNGATPLVNNIQNPSTRKFVDKVKQKLKYGKKA